MGFSWFMLDVVKIAASLIMLQIRTLFLAWVFADDRPMTPIGIFILTVQILFGKISSRAWEYSHCTTRRMVSVNAGRGFYRFSHTVLPGMSRSLSESTPCKNRAFGLFPDYSCSCFHCISVEFSLLFSFSMLFLRPGLFCSRYQPSLVVSGSGRLRVSGSGHPRV